MLKKLNKIYLLLGVFLFLVLIGVSYAYFTAGISSETTTSIQGNAGTMKITYSGGDVINLSGIYPRDEAWSTKIITITANNTTEAKMYYKLSLVVDDNTFTDDDPIYYELIGDNTSINGELISEISKTSINGSVELGLGYFTKANNAKHIYQLKFYYPNENFSQNNNQGADFSAHVEISSISEPSPSGWKEASDNTLLATLRDANPLESTLTVPGKESSAYRLEDITDSSSASVSSSEQKYYVTYGTGWEASDTKFNLTGTAVSSKTYVNSYASLVGKYLSSPYISSAGSNVAGNKTNTSGLTSIYYVESATSNSFTYKELKSNKNLSEALLASAEDDYGTSYYFRGVVKNNYLEFANKCWRIVRVMGDGSVKLVLHNDNVDKSANPCSSSNNSSGAAFITNSEFNINRDSSAYIGFMYGTKGSDYAFSNENLNKSTVLTKLEEWYASNLIENEDKLADTIWCNDRSYNYGYVASNRVVSNSPSFICPDDDNDRNFSKFTVNDNILGNGDLTYKIGLLTVDEIIYSGYSYSNKNVTYLKENASASSWWTLSPGDFSRGYAYMWSEINGSLTNYAVSSSCGVRPAIALKANVLITGTGTSEDPYKVV